MVRNTGFYLIKCIIKSTKLIISGTLIIPVTIPVKIPETINNITIPRLISPLVHFKYFLERKAS